MYKGYSGRTRKGTDNSSMTRNEAFFEQIKTFLPTVIYSH